MFKPLKKAHRFVSAHPVAVTATVTSIIWFRVMMEQGEQMNEFLEKHGLLDVYYQIED